jgi:hypothetical protein
MSSHYEIGYQGALIERLEEREKITALEAIREAVEL